MPQSIYIQKSPKGLGFISVLGGSLISGFWVHCSRIMRTILSREDKSQNNDAIVFAYYNSPSAPHLTAGLPKDGDWLV